MNAAEQLGVGSVDVPAVDGDGQMWLVSRSARWTRAINDWTAWMVAAGLSPRTIELRVWQVGHLAEDFLRRSPWSISSDELVDWLASQQGWAAETRKSYRTTLRAFYGWGLVARRRRDNPASALPRVRVAAPPPKPAPDEVLDGALDAITDRNRLILLLAAYGGLRRAEIAGLAWADVGPGVMRVAGKGRKVRLVPVHPVLAGELATERARRRAGALGTGHRYGRPDSPHLFPGQTAGHLDPGAVGRAASRALGAGWTLHTLRHRFATRAYAGSRDLLAVQALLGHAKPETTKRYTELADDALTAAVRVV